MHDAAASAELDSWWAALEARHLAALTFPEVRRALQALSGVYVERRDRLARGADLGTAGKRAAFALFYGPLHFAIARHVAASLAAGAPAPARIVDLGCGTGVVGAAAARAWPAPPAVEGVDRSAWALGEARWNWSQLGVSGRARAGDLARHRFDPAGALVTFGWALNELDDAPRAALLVAIARWRREGAGVLVLEPISRRTSPWWPEWSEAFAAWGGRDDDWRFEADMPERWQLLDRAAGLDHRELTARSLWVPPGLARSAGGSVADEHPEPAEERQAAERDREPARDEE
jgi:SAM-dependent methyltransferase